MADFALLDQLGIGRYFCFRGVVSKYRTSSISTELLEEAASDIILDVYLRYDWENQDKKMFCKYCISALRALWRVIRLNSRHEPLTSDMILYAKENRFSDNDFPERWEKFLDTVFSEIEVTNPRMRCIVTKYFIHGMTFPEVGAEVGGISKQAVQQCVEVFRSRLRAWVLENKERVYSYFELNTADTIIELAKE